MSSTLTYSTDSLQTSRLLSASISSLSSSRQQASQIAKTYRQAAQLFLTRRLPEALSTIEWVITPVQPDSDGAQENGHGDNDSAGEGKIRPAPIAASSRGTRIKVWSFYLTFLNSVIELGPEEGKHAFGSTRWKAMAGKCRDGSVWEEVVRLGYGGNETEVDADVIINLATLLLTHAPDQRTNQRRLETYLSALQNPTFDISDSYYNSQLQRRPSANNAASGTNTPRDLHTRLKLLELYTLHVLPRNEEWDYAREFIQLSGDLDDDRKEAFLLALHSLKEEKELAGQREEELRKRQEEERREQEHVRMEEEARKADASRQDEQRRRREEERAQQRQSEEHERGSNTWPRNRPREIDRDTAGNRSRAAKGKKAVARTPQNFFHRASAVLSSMQASLIQTAQSMRQNPMALFRMLLFLLAFALITGRREVRERIQRVLQNAWDKVRRTVGMGVKVSYI